MEKEAFSMENGTIIIDRDLTELDKFVREFLEALDSDYLIVSGFVSIVSGRTRATEDVDILVPQMGKEKFKEIFNKLINAGFWCYQGEEADTVYEYIATLNNIRFAKKDQMFPNMEFIPINEAKKAQWFEFNNPQKIRIKDWEFKIAPIEFEILYKEKALGSEKDLEDANHLRSFFKKILKEEMFNKSKAVISGSE